MMQPTLPFGAKTRKPGHTLLDALDWIEQNRSGWRALVASARRDADTHGRVRIKRYVEDLRDMPGTHRQTGEAFKLPNAYTPAFGRILVKWYPGLAPYVPLAHSKVDGCTIPPCPEWARHL